MTTKKKPVPLSVPLTIKKKVPPPAPLEPVPVSEPYKPNPLLLPREPLYKDRTYKCGDGVTRIIKSEDDRYLYFTDGSSLQVDCTCNLCESWGGCGWDRSTGRPGHDPPGSY